MRRLFESRIADWGSAPALLLPGQIITHQEWGVGVATWAQHLTALNLPETTIIAVLLETQWAYPLLIPAILAAGHRVLLLNKYWPEPQRLSACQFAHCRFAISDFDLFGADTTMTRYALSDFLKLPKSDVPLAAVDYDAPATFLYTSSSTGTPKLVVHSLAQHLANAAASHQRIPFSAPHLWLACLPMYHVGGLALIFRALVGGGGLVFGFRYDEITQALAQSPITHVSLVPAQLKTWLSKPEMIPAVSTLDTLLIGGAPLPDPLFHQAVNLGLPLRTTYGLTEMGSQVTTSHLFCKTAAVKHSGHPLASAQLRISDSQEILVKGDSLCLGYYQDGALRPIVDADGWFATRDMGTRDNQGQLHVTGRLDNMFISGGENIHPEEIEAVLTSLPDIAAAVVIGQPDPDFGRIPAAFIKTISGRPPEISKITAALESCLPRFKHPKTWRTWPHNYPDTGLKLDRRFFKSTHSHPTDH